MPASLNEVAAKAGVSLATASRALNGKGGVSQETRERILAIAQELQYSASMAARGLATARTDTISYVVHQRHAPLDVDPFYPVIMHGVEAELARQGYHLLLTTISDEQMRDASSFKPVSENRVDGVILAGPDISPRFIQSLKRMGLPVLLIDNASSTIQIDSVRSDDLQGGRIATEHLIEHGHRSLVALLGPQEWSSSALRGQGYREAIQAAGLQPHIFHAEGTTLETGRALMQEALAAVPDLTAVFAVNDTTAFGAMQVLARHRTLPDEVAIIGFDDIGFSALSNPPLTTIKVYKYEMGKMAARRMLDMLADPDGPSTHILLATELITRRSCGCHPSSQ